MKKKLILLLLAAAAAIKISGCEFGLEEEVPENQTVTVKGQIVESTTGDPVLNATVRISDGVNRLNAATDSEGRFNVVFELTEDQELILISFKEGYATDTLSFFATQGSTVTLPLIQMKKTQGTGNGTSGGPASIYLFSQSSQSIGVKESGSNETAQIIFEAVSYTHLTLPTKRIV